MIRIAVVGGIGSGKTYAAKLFGFPVFNADEEVSKIYKRNKLVYKKLKFNLPNFIFSFPIKKKQISNAVKSNTKNLNLISSIVHPVVRKNMYKFISVEDTLISRERHRQHLEQCILHLDEFSKKEKDSDFDKAAEDIRLAIRHLGMLVGKVDVEEILGSIFNDFCIGK